MIKRVYIDNYKRMVNFEFTPKPFQLVLGLNGSGKSTFLDVLSSLRRFVTEGQAVGDLFSQESLTRWDKRVDQRFELELAGNGGLYKYVLVVEHRAEDRLSRVKTESLHFGRGPLYVFKGGEAEFFGDNFSSGGKFPLDCARSGIFSIGPRPINTRLTWFKERLGKLFVLRVNPVLMGARSEKEEIRPAPDLSNFASWYRSLFPGVTSVAVELHKALQEIIDGFAGLILAPDGELPRILKVEVAGESGAQGKTKAFTLRFDELSDGERVLVALYTLLYCAVGPDTTLCIDEPANYVSLPEIQPWLAMLRERAEQKSAQVILASHNSEVINYLAADCAVQFEWAHQGPVRVRDFSVETPKGLPASEMIARGWDDGKA